MMIKFRFDFLLTLSLLAAMVFLSPLATAQSPQNQSKSTVAPALQAPPWTGDFDGMLKRGYLRVLVASSKTQYYVINGVQHGSSYEYFKAFEDWVNHKYPPKAKNIRFHVVFVPVARDQMFCKTCRRSRRPRGGHAGHYPRAAEDR
jgi:hypothetical protein